MNTKDSKRSKLELAVDDQPDSPSFEDIRKLKEQVHEMQLEIDILKATFDVLKRPRQYYSMKATTRMVTEG